MEKAETGWKSQELEKGFRRMAELSAAVRNPSILASLLLTHRHRLRQLQMHWGFKDGHGYLFLDSL